MRDRSDNEKKDDPSKIDYARVTRAYTTDQKDMLNPTGPRTMPMAGFDDEFVDIVDYILRITYWIWHEKQVDLCTRYYAPDSVLHTMTGDIIGNEPVVQNTWKTLEAFPDRTLDGENVVWSVEDDTSDQATYYSSHLIVSRMTNRGPSEWGPATNKRARIRTIADCVCKHNQIVEEWLMRDNAFLVQSLGYNVPTIAQQQATADRAKGFDLLEFQKPLRDKILASPRLEIVPQPPKPELDSAAFVQALFASLWQGGNPGNVRSFYDFRVTAHLTSGREVYGTLEMEEHLSSFQEGLGQVRVTIDHVAQIPFLGDAIDVAIRWSLAAIHTGDSACWGPASDTPIYILGGSHYRIINSKIREEWTVFDELAVHRQIASKRLTL